MARLLLRSFPCTHPPPPPTPREASRTPTAILIHIDYIFLAAVATGDDDTEDSSCGCSGGLSRDAPFGNGHGSAIGADVGACVSEEKNGLPTVTGDSQARRRLEEMVFVEEGEFRFGTDRPLILPVRPWVPPRISIPVTRVFYGAHRKT